MSTTARYPGIPTVIHGNGAVAHVMSHVCGGVIGYPITPSTEISEIYEAARAEGGINVWGKHAFFFEPEGEHSAQSGALGAALTGGQYISNASSSQGILYAMESHYVTVGKKIGGFVLQVAARVVSKHALNVMAGHDDVYALLASGYTMLFGSNPQEAADLAAISYRASALSLIPVANAMDGFSTSHMLSEALLPEPELLREYLGDPAGRIPCPTVAQEMLFGAKGRVFQLGGFLTRHGRDIPERDVADLRAFLAAKADEVEKDNDGALVGRDPGLGARGAARPVAPPVGQRVGEGHPPARPRARRRQQPRPDRPGAEPARLPGRLGRPPHPLRLRGAEPGAPGDGRVLRADRPPLRPGAHLRLRRRRLRHDRPRLGRRRRPRRAAVPARAGHEGRPGLGQAAPAVPRGRGRRGPRRQEGRHGARALRPDRTDPAVTAALFRARENAVEPRHDGIPALADTPRLTTAIFGLGGHDLQPRHLIAAFTELDAGTLPPLVYLGSQFFEDHPSEHGAEVQQRLRAAYPETELMALRTEPNPVLLPPGALRIRFHSVGGYGTIATGKLLTDILAGVLGMHSKSAPKYGSEKSGAPTNYYITLSPEPVCSPTPSSRTSRSSSRPTTRRSSTPTRSRAWWTAAPSCCSPACPRRRSGASCPGRRARPSARRRSTSSSSTPSRWPASTPRRPSSRPG